MSAAPPPPPPPSNASLVKQPASLPDAIFSALSLFVLFSTSPKPASLSFPVTNIKFSSPLRFRKLQKTGARSLQRLAPVFATPQSLSDWLKPRMSADLFGAWGVKPGTKNVHNLWLEIPEGETSLADSTPPVRTVEVVIVRIIRSGSNKILIESHQELSNGIIRDRRRPLSEKMKPGESIEAAVYRALREELGSVLETGIPDQNRGYSSVIHGNVKIIPGSYVRRVEERVSASYPGLPACYVLHTVDTEVDGLPECDFFTEETSEYGGLDENSWVDFAVSCKKHYWRWVDCDSA